MCALLSPILEQWPIPLIGRQEWSMRTSRIAFLAMLLIGARLVPAQVVSPVEISDPAMRTLQERSINDLNAVGQNIAGTQFALSITTALQCSPSPATTTVHTRQTNSTKSSGRAKLFWMLWCPS